MEKGEAIPCGEDMLVSAAEVTGGLGRAPATLSASPDGCISHTIGRVRQLILQAAILAILVSALPRTCCSPNRLSEPLVAMRALAEKMAKGDYASRVASGAEMKSGQLAQSLNSLASGLEQALGQLRCGAG